MNARRERHDYAGNTDPGRVRTSNEDSLLMNPPLFAVADGLGGHEAGEIASRIAVDTLLDTAPRTPDAKALGRAVRSANTAVIEAAEEGRGRAGMGTTLTTVMVDGTSLHVAHVGDSRAYVLHIGELVQLTDDHSMVADMIRRGTLTEEESRFHPNRSVITRALGSDPNMVADAFTVEAAPGDRLLLCTDGLTGMVSDDAIEDVLATAIDPAAAVNRLIDAANAAGGHDNITAVVVDIAGASASTGQRRSTGAGRQWAGRLLWLAAAAGLVSAGIWGAYSQAHSRAYLIAEEGFVSVYRGIPGEFAGIELRWLEQETTIPVDALNSITAARLREGVRVKDLAAAESLIEQYAAEVGSSATTDSVETTTP